MSDDIKLILVNKEHPLESEMAPDLVPTPKGISTGDYLLNQETLFFFLFLREEALKLGIDLRIDGGHRTLARQQAIFDQFAQEKGFDYARSIVAPVGTSEHHTGLAIDLSLKIGDVVLEDNDDLYANATLFKQVEPLLARFGFILRYPEGKENVTGYAYEPWHIRYIGVENALDMQQRGVATLEEYLQVIRSTSR